MNNQKENLSGIDVFKFIMAFSVVAIHTSSKSVSGGQSFPFIIEWFISLAVPYFFISSGFLICRKLSEPNVLSPSIILFQRSKKLIRLFGYWLLIYIPIAVLHYTLDHTPLITAVKEYLISIIFKGESPYSWPLWFIYSMAISYFLLSFIQFNTRNLKLIFILFFIIYIFNFYDYNYLVLKGIKFITHRSLLGGVFILCGMLLYRYGKRFGRCGIGLLLLTSVTLKILDYPLSDLIGGVAIFSLGISITLKQSSNYQKLRKLSMWIYYTHMLILYPFVVYGNKSGVYFNLYYVFVIASLIVLIESYVLMKLQNSYQFRWLGKLIS